MSRDQEGRRVARAAGVAVAADRRFRRGEAVPVRRRRGRPLWTVVRWLAITAGLAALAVWGGQRLMASDMFLVRDITVRGNTRLSAGEVEMLLDGIRNENVFLVDFEQYRRQVMDSSWVEQVTLSRILPATIVVDVVERTPMVVARVNQQLYLVDRTGNIVDEYRAEHHSFDLPIVDGLVVPSDGGDAVVDAERMTAVVGLVDDMSARADLQRRLSHVDVTNPRDIVVMIDDDPAWLHLGDASFVDRLERYLDVRPALLDRFGAIEYADLKFDERIYVRGRDGRAARTMATR